MALGESTRYDLPNALCIELKIYVLAINSWVLVTVKIVDHADQCLQLLHPVLLQRLRGNVGGIDFSANSSYTEASLFNEPLYP